MSYIVAIDQGTTSTRSILFDHNMRAVNISQRSLHNISLIQVGLSMIQKTYGIQQYIHLKMCYKNQN